MTFKKGKSGNPGGRPKTLGAVQDLARKYTEEAITQLAAIASDEKIRADYPSVAVRAYEALLDRAWGKPKQGVELSGEGGGVPAIYINVKKVDGDTSKS